MSYTMRPLKTSDIFKMSKILKKLDVKTNEIKVDDKTSQTQVGIALIQKALENLHLAENEVNDFIGGLVGLTGEEFGNLELNEAIKIIKLFKEQKGIADFLTIAGE